MSQTEFENRLLRIAETVVEEIYYGSVTEKQAIQVFERLKNNLNRRIKILRERGKMLLQFETYDESLWLADVFEMKWARISAPPDPKNPGASVVLEHGKLLPQGFGVYIFEGLKKDGPGNGLASIGNFVVALGNVIKIFIRANVPIKNFTMPAPIKTILYEILPTDPNQIQNSIQGVADANQGQEIAPGQEEPKIAGNLPETTQGTEPSSPEAGIQSGNEGVESASSESELK